MASSRLPRATPKAASARPLALLLLAFLASAVKADLSHEGDLSVRIDDASESDFRFQYRFRYRLNLDWQGGWSMHTFAATGDDFTSAYTTIGDNEHEFNVRRLFARYEGTRGKLELGSIPPFKGRVSSTGLSQEGWIKGLRGVLNFKPGRLELVLGELDDLNPRRALAPPSELNYVELEYSGSINDRLSFEGSIERILDSNFVRSELRYDPSDTTGYSIEVVHNLNTRKDRFLMGMTRLLNFEGNELDWFIYYSHVARGFGPRAELTEDFLEFGHALATELSATVGDAGRLSWLSWFAKAEFYEGNSRGMLGLTAEFE
ncbi:MAG: hypothetical protein AAGE85_07500 [Pseudomonadota bacterium]